MNRRARRVSQPLPRSKWLSIRQAFGVFLCALGMSYAVGGEPKQPLTTLQIAQEQVAKHAGWKYGSDQNSKHIDCVQFVLAVVEAKLRKELSAQQRQAALLAYNWKDSEIQSFAEAGAEPKLAGVVHALTKLGGEGESVPPADARPGDIIQYWMKRQDGIWFGHSGIISAVNNGAVKIIGAHRSPEPDGTIGENSTPLRLTGPRRHVFIVRI